MQRFYLPEIDYSSLEIILRNQDFPELHNQITRVLRAKVGDEILCFSGTGIDFCYQITSITKDSIFLVRNQKKDEVRDVLESKLHLFQSLPNKSEKLEFILQKGTEIGVTDFHFFPSERSQVTSIVYGEKRNKYGDFSSGSVNYAERTQEITKSLARLQKITIEATEQSFGPKIPEIHLYNSCPSFEGVAFIAHTIQETEGIIKLSDLASKSEYFKGDISLLIGPEGGWSEKEVAEFVDKGAIPVSFGERILRTETASIALAFFLRQLQDYQRKK